jgi:hypothetical protein
MVSFAMVTDIAAILREFSIESPDIRVLAELSSLQKTILYGILFAMLVRQIPSKIVRVFRVVFLKASASVG